MKICLIWIISLMRDSRGLSEGWKYSTNKIEVIGEPSKLANNCNRKGTVWNNRKTFRANSEDQFLKIMTIFRYLLAHLSWVTNRVSMMMTKNRSLRFMRVTSQQTKIGKPRNQDHQPQEHISLKIHIIRFQTVGAQHPIITNLGTHQNIINGSLNRIEFIRQKWGSETKYFSSSLSYSDMVTGILNLCSETATNKISSHPNTSIKSNKNKNHNILTRTVSLTSSEVIHDPNHRNETKHKELPKADYQRA